MWEEKRAKIIGWNNKNFVRSITYSWNAVSAFPLNDMNGKVEISQYTSTVPEYMHLSTLPVMVLCVFNYIFYLAQINVCKLMFVIY